MTASAAPVVRRGGVLGILAVAEFMLTLDLSIVNVALPSMRAQLGFSEASLQWVVNGYSLAFGGFLLLGGRMADVFGARRVFVWSLGVFSLASLAAGLASNQVLLIAARVVQGLSAGVLSPATLSVLTATYRQENERNRALSIWTAVAIGGGSIGAVAGGLLTDLLNWRWIFFLNAPIGATLVVLARQRLRSRTDRPAAAKLDLTGAMTVTGGLTALIWGLIHRDAVAFVVAAALLTAFAVVELRLATSPLVPFARFRSRRLSAGNGMSFLSFVPVMATWYLLTLYLQSVRGYSPLRTGLLFLPASLAVVIGSQISFRLIAKVDARVLFACGGLLAAAGMGWLGRLSDTTSLTQVIVSACLAMAGGGLMFAPITVSATSGLPAGEGGLASGLLNTSRQLGGSLGLAVLGVIAAGHGTAGYAKAFATGAAIFLVTAAAGAMALPADLHPAAEETQP